MGQLTSIRVHRSLPWLVCGVDRRELVVSVNVVYRGNKLMRQLSGLAGLIGSQKKAPYLVHSIL